MSLTNKQKAILYQAKQGRYVCHILAHQPEVADLLERKYIIEDKCLGGYHFYKATEWGVNAIRDASLMVLQVNIPGQPPLILVDSKDLAHDIESGILYDVLSYTEGLSEQSANSSKSTQNGLISWKEAVKQEAETYQALQEEITAGREAEGRYWQFLDDNTLFSVGARRMTVAELEQLPDWEPV
jgi:hypothetical protein